MKRRMGAAILMAALLLQGLTGDGAAAGDYIRWVDFDVSYEALEQALELDIRSQEGEMPISWITLLALGACRTGGKVTGQAVRQAKGDLDTGKSPEELLGEHYKTYLYYQRAYEAALGGLVGDFAIETEQGTKYTYGLKGFSPIAAGYGYSHYDDFGNARSFGFARKHLGNDLMGALGTPIVAVEGGVVEALGWNRYGGWRVGIRSHDRKRYYYYAHLRKDNPFAPGLRQGDVVEYGQLLGFMGRTGYSDRENVNNIETVHLHFGLQLVFDESQKECDSEIWIDVYNILRLLDHHRCTWVREETGQWIRRYPWHRSDPAAATFPATGGDTEPHRPGTEKNFVQNRQKTPGKFSCIPLVSQKYL